MLLRISLWLAEPHSSPGAQKALGLTFRRLRGRDTGMVSSEEQVLLQYISNFEKFKNDVSYKTLKSFMGPAMS